MWQALAEGIVAFLIAFTLGTLVEYSVHRLMHNRTLLGKKHAEHHRDGWGQGWLGEFWDYFIGTVPVMAVAFQRTRLLMRRSRSRLPGKMGWRSGAMVLM